MCNILAAHSALNLCIELGSWFYFTPSIMQWVILRLTFISETIIIGTTRCNAAGELCWLHPVSHHGLWWDGDVSHNADLRDVRELMARALREPLVPAEQQQVNFRV